MPIRGRNVYVQFSSHQELTIMDQSSQARGDEVTIMYLVTISYTSVIAYCLLDSLYAVCRNDYMLELV